MAMSFLWNIYSYVVVNNIWLALNGILHVMVRCNVGLHLDSFQLYKDQASKQEDILKFTQIRLGTDLEVLIWTFL